MGSKPFVEAEHCDHNPDFECAWCATLRHDTEHLDPVGGCRICKFKGLRISPRVGMESRGRRVGQPRETKNSWERGIARDERGMPLLKPDGSYLGIKEYGEKRHSVDAALRSLRSSPTSPEE
jgi:hypothetical protein